jgi:polyphosphate glucokinase
VTTPEQQRKILVVDVGGTHVKIRVSRNDEVRKCESGPKLTAREMVDGVLAVAEDWEYDVVSVGFPGPVLDNRPVREPVNLGTGWAGFDYDAAFGCPVKVINDAAMQALGSYEGGRMLFLGLGTGLGSAMVVDGILQPLELGHLPYKRGGSFEDYVGVAGLKRRGKRRWRASVKDVIERLRDALQPEYIVLGGGNVKKLEELPEGTRLGANANAFIGGFRLWEPRYSISSGHREPQAG